MKMTRCIAARFRFLGFAIAMCGGCAGGGFGESVSIPQKHQARIDEGFSSGSKLSIPADTAFNVADAQRHSTGSGKSESVADADGTASCRASVRDGGGAWAEFQLGHVIYNARTESLEAAATFDCEFAYGVSGDDLAARAPDLVGLKLYIQDSNRRILHRVVLANQDDTLGADRRTGRETPSFNFTMEPGLAYTLVVAGRVELAEVENATGSVEAWIDVTKLSITVEAR